MKILMLTPYLPWPLNSGGQIRTYNLLKNLAHKHEISLFSFIRDDDEKKYVGKLKPYCRKIMLFKRTQSPWAIRNILLAGLTPYPFLVCIYLSKAAKDALTQELNQEKYDIIHAETFYVMPNIPATAIPTLLVEQTIEYLGYQTYTEQKAMPFLRPMLYIDVIKLKFWEKHYWRKADRVFAVSSEDKKVMQELIPGLEVGVIPNGVDADYYAEKKLPRKSPPCVMYGVTNFEWLQNVEAVRELVTKVWPGIIAKVPGVRLWIVGRMIPSWIKEMSEKRSDIFSSPESIEKNWQNILGELDEIVKEYNNSVSLTTVANSPWRVWGEVKRHRTLRQSAESIYHAVDRGVRVAKNTGYFVREGKNEDLRFLFPRAKGT